MKTCCARGEPPGGVSLSPGGGVGGLSHAGAAISSVPVSPSPPAPRHIFLGFSKCGRYVLSYTSNGGDDDFSFYIYHLYWWEFNVHSKLKLVPLPPPRADGRMDRPSQGLFRGVPRPPPRPPRPSRRCGRSGSSRMRRFTVTCT